MTPDEMRESADRFVGMSGESGEEPRSILLACGVMWSVCAEICERLDKQYRLTGELNRRLGNLGGRENK